MKGRPTHNADLPFTRAGWEGNPKNAKDEYINLDGASERNIMDVLRWQLTRNPFRERKKKLRSNVEVLENNDFIHDNADGITFIGHATYFITVSNMRLITDPVFYQVGLLKRNTKLPCEVSEFNNIDYILLSHNHRDHCDKKSLQELCALNPSAIILTGLGLSRLLRGWKIKNEIIEAGWFQRFQLKQSVTIDYLPAKHWSRRGLTDLNEMLWGSFMINVPGRAPVYFAADSGMGKHFEMIGDAYSKISHAMIGIGAFEPEWFMRPSHTNPKEALQAFSRLRAAHFIPMHFGTFDLSDEPLDYPLENLQKMITSFDPASIIIPVIGKKIFIH